MYCKYKDSSSNVINLEIPVSKVEQDLKISVTTRKRYCKVARQIAPKLGFFVGQTYFTIAQFNALKTIQKWASMKKLRYFVDLCLERGFPYEN